MAKLTAKEKARIQELRQQFPEYIDVVVTPCDEDEGGFFAEVVTFPGCVTQGETLSELNAMINDVVATVLEIPKEYISYMPTYVAPAQLYQRFNLFPMPEEKGSPLRFSIPT